ncbi:MAG: molybdenum cofactor guanylyltransferase MobA [Epsilonproteobacteria bacterium]|nr:MAG: molybdenum cofactor guanylyltransferase MobA [Campylobacterota bacterium]
MIKKFPLVIIAGGKSSRMGKDKALLPFGKYPTLTQFQYKKLSLYFQDVYISSKTDKFDFECTVIKDTRKEHSPLIAILSIFETLKVDEIFILSVDSPFVDKEVIETILKSRNDKSDIVVAKSPSGIQPLCGCYKKSILPLAYAQLEKGKHKLLDLLALADTQFVEFEEDEPFTNLNHPQEYQKALKDS